MKRSSSPGFTLIEMLTVMAVIAVLASLIVAVQAYANKKAAVTRADGEIHAMTSSCENYKADFGVYPRDDSAEQVTDLLDPREDGDPASAKYRNASLFLYKMLSGDAVQGTTPPTTPTTTADRPDGKAETKGYHEFSASALRKTSNNEIQFIQDPFGNAYGYSTAGAASADKFREELQKNPNATRGEEKGFNPTFDLWSTGGVTSAGTDINEKRKRWVKNW